MKNLPRLSKLKKNPPVLLFATGLFLNASLWAYILYQINNSPDLVPLHYTIYFGIDLIDYKYKLLLYPILGIIVFTINALLGCLCRKERLIMYFLLSLTIVIQILFLLTAIALVVNYY